jgi:hypothetical protein
LGIYKAGTGANVSPSTTTIASPLLFTYTETAANYSWAAVNATIDPVALTYDVDNGGATDRFLSWLVPFSDLVAAFTSIGINGINENSTVSYVAATATQANSLNQDLNGVNAGVNSSSTWATLGAISVPMTPQGLPIPEPTAGTVLTMSLGLLGWCGFRKRS